MALRRSGLPERLDLQCDGDLVADDGAAGFQGHVDVDAEVLAVQTTEASKPATSPWPMPGLTPLNSSSRVTGLVTPFRVKSPSTR